MINDIFLFSEDIIMIMESFRVIIGTSFHASGT